MFDLSAQCKISYTRRSVSSDNQTSRSELKNKVIGKFFNQLQGVWISYERQLSSILYYISNESELKEKIRFKVVESLCLLRSGIETTCQYWFPLCFTHELFMHLRCNSSSTSLSVSLEFQIWENNENWGGGSEVFVVFECLESADAT